MSVTIHLTNKEYALIETALRWYVAYQRELIQKECASFNPPVPYERAESIPSNLLYARARDAGTSLLAKLENVR